MSIATRNQPAGDALASTGDPCADRLCQEVQQIINNADLTVAEKLRRIERAAVLILEAEETIKKIKAGGSGAGEAGELEDIESSGDLTEKIRTPTEQKREADKLQPGHVAESQSGAWDPWSAAKRLATPAGNRFASIAPIDSGGNKNVLESKTPPVRPKRRSLVPWDPRAAVARLFGRRFQ